MTGQAWGTTERKCFRSIPWTPGLYDLVSGCVILRDRKKKGGEKMWVATLFL